VPLDAPAGSYDFVITANHYTLESAPFDVVPTDALKVTAQRTPDGHAQLTLNYPRAIENTDFTFRPPAADGGSVTANVGGASRAVSQGSGTRFDVPASQGDTVSVPAGEFSDRWGNSNGEGASFQGS
jgi:hypothetical protein